MGKLETNKKKKKDALFSTAFELFTTKGLAKTTISDIVESAGVAKGTFYLYFRDKNDIRNKLVSHKTSELFSEAWEELQKKSLSGFENQMNFIIDYIIYKLESDRALLLFIAKNLSWGVFKSALDEKVPYDSYQFYETYLQLLEKSNFSCINPEVMLFTIIELVGSTCYSCILYGQPVSMDEYRPFLHGAIHGILKTFEAKELTMTEEVCP